MPKFLSLLTPLLALVGCGKCIPIEFTPEERAWVSAYRPGQQVRFRMLRYELASGEVYELAE